MLDEGTFSHWKFRMRHIIRGIDKDAWMTVEQGWAAHMMLMEDKKKNAPKPKERQTGPDKATLKIQLKGFRIETMIVPIINSPGLTQLRVP